METYLTIKEMGRKALTMAQITARNDAEGLPEEEWGLLQKGYELKYGEAHGDWALVNSLKNLKAQAETAFSGYNPNKLFVLSGVVYGTYEVQAQFVLFDSDNYLYVPSAELPEKEHTEEASAST